MRISDWSSDVCSSDLPVARQVEVAHYLRPQQAADVGAVGVGPAGIELAAGRGAADVVAALQRQGLEAASRQVAGSGEAVVRSEEHTSELQSLMRISYAVFCLKKKKNTETGTSHRRESLP